MLDGIQMWARDAEDWRSLQSGTALNSREREGRILMFDYFGSVVPNYSIATSGNWVEIVLDEHLAEKLHACLRTRFAKARGLLQVLPHVVPI